MGDINKVKKDCKTLSIAVFFAAAAEIAVGIFALVMGANGGYLAWNLLRVAGGAFILGYAFLVLQALKDSNNFAARMILIVAGLVCSNVGRYMSSDNSWWINSFIFIPCLVEYYLNAYKKLSD